MSYNFTPMTEEELNKSFLLSDGIYDFIVKKSERKTSEAGNPMAELLLGLYDSEGNIRYVKDYLVFSTVNLCVRKIKHFCESVGITEDYEKGSVREELVDLSGKLKLGIQGEKPNPNGGNYPAKNIVIDYVKADKVVEKPTEKKDDFNDDIPF
jgi:hypothetical protein